jgi:CHAT domain-containing protein
LAGLALAGANLRNDIDPAVDEDGILTTEEVAALDLGGVDWVVLSACDTGVGDIVGGEGVLGLRRAFQIAGAKTVISSLWSVADSDVAPLMEALYAGRDADGFGATTALRSASRHILDERRAAGKSTHPFHWGGFVSVGR